MTQPETKRTERKILVPSSREEMNEARAGGIDRFIARDYEPGSNLLIIHEALIYDFYDRKLGAVFREVPKFLGPRREEYQELVDELKQTGMWEG